jgi:ferrous iron transport protein B
MPAWARWASGCSAHLPEGLLRSLLVDGIVAGAGGVLVFLPQILILFFFILALEDSGYLPRAAFLLDRVMGSVGLSGRSFIPLLSSFACAIPGIMATRTITHWRERLVTIMIAPLMTCSARLPVYALLIAAFIPERTVAGVFNLQGLVMFALYLGGILGAMAVAAVLKLWRGTVRPTPLIMELPPYRLPSAAQPGAGPVRARQPFSSSAWAASSWRCRCCCGSCRPSRRRPRGPRARPSSTAWRASGAARWRWCWRRWVSTGRSPWPWCPAWRRARWWSVRWARCTRCRPRATRRRRSSALIAQQWSLATALSLLVWFVFAPQCISTLATVRRETNSWRLALLMATYMFALAYAPAGHVPRGAGHGRRLTVHVAEPGGGCHRGPGGPICAVVLDARSPAQAPGFPAPCAGQGAFVRRVQRLRRGCATPCRRRPGCPPCR